MKKIPDSLYRKEHRNGELQTSDENLEMEDLKNSPVHDRKKT